jgi:hypothetical protein
VVAVEPTPPQWCWWTAALRRHRHRAGPGADRGGVPVSDIIPTPETAALAAAVLRRVDGLGATRGVVLPLLEAIAAGRVFEVRPERCDARSARLAESYTAYDAGCYDRGRRRGRCARRVLRPLRRLDLEPAPPGRKQRTAYDAMIEEHRRRGGAPNTPSSSRRAKPDLQAMMLSSAWKNRTSSPDMPWRRMRVPSTATVRR